jgi:hypothetical protein
MLHDQFTEPESPVEFTHQDEATVRRNATALKADLERRIEGKLKGPFLHLSHWVLNSERFHRIRTLINIGDCDALRAQKYGPKWKYGIALFRARLEIYG